MRPTPRPAHATRAATSNIVLGLTLGAALLAAPTSAAHAQFGGLLKRAAAAAAEKAGGSAKDAAAEKAGVGPRTASPAGDADQLEITPERLDAFLVGMRGPIEAAQQRAAFAERRTAWEKAVAEHRERKQAYAACRERLGNSVKPDLSPAAQARQARLTDAMGAVADRMAKANEAGNQDLAARLADSVEVLQRATVDVLYPTLVRTCGSQPSDAGPQPPTGDAPDRNGPALRPTVPAGMTARQFGTLRERVAAWLIATDRRYVYAPAEQQALESRRAALAPLAPLFRGDHLPWGYFLHGLGKES